MTVTADGRSRASIDTSMTDYFRQYDGLCYVFFGGKGGVAHGAERARHVDPGEAAA